MATDRHAGAARPPQPTRNITTSGTRAKLQTQRHAVPHVVCLRSAFFARKKSGAREPRPSCRTEVCQRQTFCRQSHRSEWAGQELVSEARDGTKPASDLVHKGWLG